MSVGDWFRRRTPLQLALERCRRSGADLSEELRRLGDYSIRRRADAEAICEAIDSAEISSDTFRALVGLFQEIDVESADPGVFSMLRDKGIPRIIGHVNLALDKLDPETTYSVLYPLKILAMYGTRAGAETIVRAARVPVEPESYMWATICGTFAQIESQREWLFAQLSDPLPNGFIAVALLDAANGVAMEGRPFSHPFDSPQGKRQVEHWLRDSNAENASYAISATVALPFISPPERDQLLAISLDHPLPNVQLEAAWAAAKMGRQAGLAILTRFCLDLNFSSKAVTYLHELGRSEHIPEEVNDPDFAAKAVFAQWLAHPNELGRPPDELEILDHRNLRWPPEFESKPFWLIRYRLRDETGLTEDDVSDGLVGSITFCFFFFALELRPPDDAYALHCYWEMEQGHITDKTVDLGCHEYDSMLRQWSREPVQKARVIRVAELSPSLRHPQRLVALAEAIKGDEAGWLVLDGTRSRWYAASDMPKEQSSKIVLMLHIGRQLLGFTDEPDRAHYLKQALPRRSSTEIIEAFERYLDTARRDPVQNAKLLGNSSILTKGFDRYVDARIAQGAKPRAQVIADSYERLLDLAGAADASLQESFHDSFAPLGWHFATYVDALVELGRSSDVGTLVGRFRKYWNHNLGYGQLGRAAFQCGDDVTAEPFLVRLREDLKDWYRSHEMSDLAEIWHRSGRVEDAHQLLIEALQRVLAEARSSGEPEIYEEVYIKHRSTFVRLFPDRAEPELKAVNLPLTISDSG